MSHGLALDLVTGFSYWSLEILPVPSNNNTNITCEVIDVNGALVESNSIVLLIQGNIFPCSIECTFVQHYLLLSVELEITRMC